MEENALLKKIMEGEKNGAANPGQHKTPDHEVLPLA
jgi:hypothetical protein